MKSQLCEGKRAGIIQVLKYLDYDFYVETAISCYIQTTIFTQNRITVQILVAMHFTILDLNKEVNTVEASCFGLRNHLILLIYINILIMHYKCSKMLLFKKNIYYNKYIQINYCCLSVYNIYFYCHYFKMARETFGIWNFPAYIFPFAAEDIFSHFKSIIASVPLHAFGFTAHPA